MLLKLGDVAFLLIVLVALWWNSSLSWWIFTGALAVGTVINLIATKQRARRASAEMETIIKSIRDQRQPRSPESSTGATASF